MPAKPVYDWTIVDRIFDTYLERGVKPYVQIGFMPKAMSIKPEPYQHMWTPTAKYDEIYTGWSPRPRTMRSGGARVPVDETLRRSTGRGSGAGHSKPGTRRTSATGAARRRSSANSMITPSPACGARCRRPGSAVPIPPEAAASGCATSSTSFAARTSRPARPARRSISSRFTPRAARLCRRPRAGISNQLATIDDGFRIIASYPELKSKPIVIGESDPEGARPARDRSCSTATRRYSSYTAASFARKHDLADRHGVNLEGALTWAFEFGETPFFAGSALATNGINLPVFNVFRMFSRMGRSGSRRRATTPSTSTPS